jgi:hypothetical protein
VFLHFLLAGNLNFINEFIIYDPLLSRTVCFMNKAFNETLVFIVL